MKNISTKKSVVLIAAVIVLILAGIIISVSTDKNRKKQEADSKASVSVTRTDLKNEASSQQQNIKEDVYKRQNVDMLIAPAAMNAGDIYKGSYTAAQLQALLMGGGVKFYTKDATGAEIKDVVRCLVEGCGRDDDPISWDTLPASSGFTMKISRDDKGNMHLRCV